MTALAEHVTSIEPGPADFPSAISAFVRDAGHADATAHMRTLTLVTTGPASPASQALMAQLDTLIPAGVLVQIAFGRSGAGAQTADWVNQWRQLAAKHDTIEVRVADMDSDAFETMVLGRTAIWLGDVLTGAGYDAESDDFLTPDCADWPVQAAVLRDFTSITVERASPLA